MTKLALLNIDKTGISVNTIRFLPLITWLHLLNFFTIAMISLLFLKIYKGLLIFYEWLFPFKHHFRDPIILVIAPKNDLIQEIILQLSQRFNSKIVDYLGVNDNAIKSVRGKQRQSQIIHYKHVPIESQETVGQLSKDLERKFGYIDVLFIAQDEALAERTPTDSFLLTLNKHLLAQFWTAMAFLPGMLRRNSGHVVSVALGRRSSLANTGIMRTIHEDLLKTDTKVRLTLVERNMFFDDYLIPLSNDILARLIVRSLWGSESLVKIPSFPCYLVMLPLLITRLLMKPLMKLANFTTSRSV